MNKASGVFEDKTKYINKQQNKCDIIASFVIILNNLYRLKQM